MELLRGQGRQTSWQAWVRWLGALGIAGLAFAPSAFAVGPGPKAPAKRPEETKAAPKSTSKSSKPDPDDDLPPIADQPAVRKSFSKGEVERICARYEGQLIAYYGDVFRVEHCRRRPLLDNKTVYNLQREGKKVQDVDGDTVAALPEGEAVDEATSISAARGCKQLEGHYVTFSNTDVYFVEKCKKRIFPDWTTYIKHRELHGDKQGEILSLSWIEFDQLKPGEPVPSIVDDMFRKLLTGEAGVEIIPVNEACEGVEGKYTSYYSRLYKIERCHKREIVEPDYFLQRIGGSNNIKIVELKSEQWLSLPDGQPLVEKPRQTPDGAKEYKKR